MMRIASSPARGFRLTALLLLLIAITLGCRSLTTPPAADAEEQEHRQPFLDALSKARAAEGTDSLSSLLNVQRRIQLTAPYATHISRFLPFGDEFVVGDFLSSRVDVFGNDGRWVRRVGRAGTAPGAFIMPTGLAALTDDEFAVLDFRPARISVFDAAGTFRRSTPYSKHRFAGVQLAYARESGDYYLFGWRPSTDGGRQTSKLIHRLSDQGSLTGSWIEAPDEKQAPWASVYYEPVTAVARDRVFVAFPFSNEVYRVDASGAVSVVANAYPEGFKAPSRTMKVGRSAAREPVAEHYQRFHTWRLGWTPIDGVAVVGDTLLVATQTFDPLRYRLETWSLSSRKRLQVTHTNHLLLGADANGTLYFRASADLDKEGPDAVITASLR